ncbi:MAG: HAMP domain-containing histidine kinase [Lachnospiraceae bacterium]|nr:HAMP domain-containing histidine kinase [Lachnospiraceae bacterium]
MIKRVRKRFIMIAMIAIIICTTILVVTINLVNFIQVDQQVDRILNSIANNNGVFTPKPGSMLGMGGRGGAPQEMQYETRYFSVKIGTDGSMQTELTHIASVDEDAAIALAQEALEDNVGLTSYIDTYKYIVYSGKDGETSVTFIDCESRIKMLRSLALSSLGIEGVGVLVMFLIIFFSSKRAIQPVIESSEKQKRFITDASHELKTPLTVIATNMDILTMDLGDNEWVQGTQKQVSNLRRLVNNLVSLSRLEEENTMLAEEKFNLSKAVRESAEPFMSMAEFDGCTVKMEIPEAVQITGDESMVRQLATILCDNAVKYVSKGGDIGVKVEKHGRRAVLEVSNSCDDEIPKETLKRLFDRFYRADESRTKEHGKSSFGIGLSIAKAIVEKRGGKISAMQDTTRRVTFRAEL